MNAHQITRYRKGIAQVLSGIAFTHSCTLNLRTSHQTIERADQVARQFYWNLTKEAFTKKAIKTGRRQLSFAAVIEGREGINLHLHLAVGHFNKNHDNDLILSHFKNAAKKTAGVWHRPLTKDEQRLYRMLGTQSEEERNLELLHIDTFVVKPIHNQGGWIEYILLENNFDRTYDQPIFDTRDADRILVDQFRAGN
ncbi:hypothetical protein P8935_09050 [Telmatobacter sp. DSM 110680]|uniref:Replication protein n=1 Tax=Telmatobacter sp. DSM 110680 TaxID=3036704 RepID=A0AAU7DQ89_9BACT